MYCVLSYSSFTAFAPRLNHELFSFGGGGIDSEIKAVCHHV